jgi:hypothetical protein
MKADICKVLEENLKMHWQAETDNGVVSFQGQYDEAFFKAICRAVAGALDPRPTHRWTPVRMLEELDKTGK